MRRCLQLHQPRFPQRRTQKPMINAGAIAMQENLAKDMAEKLRGSTQWIAALA